MNVSCCCSLLRLSPGVTLSACGAVLGIDADCRKLLQKKTMAEVALISVSLLLVLNCSCLCRNSTDHSAVATLASRSSLLFSQVVSTSSKKCHHLLCIACLGSGKNNPNWSYSKSPFMQTQNWKGWGKENQNIVTEPQKEHCLCFSAPIYRILFKLQKTELLSPSH